MNHEIGNNNNNPEEQPNENGNEWLILTETAKPVQEEEPAQTAELAQETENNQENLHDPRVESLAIPLARDYAEKNYPKLEDGTFQPAWRGVNGEKAYKGKSPEDLMAEGMSEEEARAAVIDIANTPYDQYSEYWKDQNRGGAEYLISLLDEMGADEILDQDFAEDEDARQKFGDLIHNNWLDRNEWVKNPDYGDPALAKPYAELDPVEQQKDIDQAVILQKWILEQQNAGEGEQ